MSGMETRVVFALPLDPALVFSDSALGQLAKQIVGKPIRAGVRGEADGDEVGRVVEARVSGDRVWVVADVDFPGGGEALDAFRFGVDAEVSIRRPEVRDALEAAGFVVEGVSGAAVAALPVEMAPPGATQVVREVRCALEEPELPRCGRSVLLGWTCDRPVGHVGSCSCDPG
jgi:hypothetical protein